jgi:hypothetical protein
MTTNNNTNGDGLNPAARKQKPSGRKGGDAFVLALATGLSIPQAASRAGISNATAYVRADKPEVRQAVAKARDQLLAQVLGQLVEAGCKAVNTLTANLADESAGTRNKAAATILANLIHGYSMVEILRRLEQLEGDSV